MKKRTIRTKVKQIKCSRLPAACIALPGILLVRRGTPCLDTRHGAIHAAQQFELLLAGFIAAAIAVVCTSLSAWWLAAGFLAPPAACAAAHAALLIPSGKGILRYTCFETEALRHEADPFYLLRRRPFAWLFPAPWRRKSRKR